MASEVAERRCLRAEGGETERVMARAAVDWQRPDWGREGDRDRAGVEGEERWIVMAALRWEARTAYVDGVVDRDVVIFE